MKRSLNILMASLLSLMIVYLSVGASVMHCLSNDTLTVGMAANCCLAKCHSDKHCCHDKSVAQWKKHCMDIKQVKLSPTPLMQKVQFDAAPAFAGIAPWAWSVLPRPVVCHIKKSKYLNRNEAHAPPPREYLTLLNVLTI